MSFVKQGKTASMKKTPKGKCHGCCMVNDHFLSYQKVVSKEAKKKIMATKKEEYKAKKQGVFATEVQKNEVESDKTENPPDTTYEELKEMFGFTNLSVYHSDGDKVVDFGFYQVVTHNDEVPMLNPTTSGVDEIDDSTTYMVADNRVKKGMVFVDIVCDNQSPK